ncbi:MAG: aliphatic sulfonate ABC transporter ATP-binding protein [Cereibacter sphaeroides]|uniref:Aliphatic sulfonate ABC transporter ATP-binding protein n=1 Tax=Cereibacter sphaeroides TaxID=1063 RepID=A0A2W5SE74_CERSP|nr:MAG: aliphatic sulfonate ABC transporter ATP-binding protein [Cereibacter sphaeroides]
MLDNSSTIGAAVSLRGVEKRFGANAVLSGLHLDIRPGEFLSIVGKSGCGKSTLLRLIAGLDQPSGGEIEVGGETPEAAARDQVRIMFQEPRLLPWATVQDNVRLGLPEEGVPAVLNGRALGALQAVQLEAKADAWPASLSGGQKSRVALARALVSQPKLLALDEPLGALDALTRIVMQDLILQVKRDVGFTAILVTHDVAEAVAMSDRVIVLDGGRIAHEEMITLPHPRPKASAELAAVEARILGAIFR